MQQKSEIEKGDFFISIIMNLFKQLNDSVGNYNDENNNSHLENDSVENDNVNHDNFNVENDNVDKIVKTITR